ncbi:hypothetical protein ONE63_007241 [Megalurothrips usitatus]|uniref:RecA family profile 1 domain-containing protein n=1 Tax=Megalurothrips usitatus TaxID=439358 RepID=A0AAV7XWA8_9NEOP|nr:hypothetical protein ONE63_007241 [Megalurothrips usitatus]
MAKLSTSMCQVLTKTAIENLGQRKIFTVVDVLQEDPKKLASISKLDFKDILTLRQALVSNYTPFPRQGLDAYNELMSNCSYIPTGIQKLDELLGGGFLTGNVFEICGLSGSGKTQLCLTVAANVALQMKKVVHLIDTKLDVSGKRIHSIIEGRESDEEYMGNYKMDSLGLLNNLASLVKYIAHEHYVSILIINLASIWVEEESAPLNDDSQMEPPVPHVDVKALLGKYWAHVPNTRLYIEQNGVPNGRKVTVMKSTHLALGSSCIVSITSDGVR